MVEFRMPSLGADMTEGTLLHWIVHPGDIVHKGDIVAEVDTTKAAIEVECFDDGVIGTIAVPEGETVPVGAVLATIEPPGARAAAPGGRAPEAHEVRATPLIHRLADQAGLDLSLLHGSGPNGRIVRADVERAAAQQDTATGDKAAAPPTAPPGQNRRQSTVTGSDTARTPASSSRRRARRRSTEHPAPRHGTPVPANPVSPTDATAGLVRASGYARRLATELGIDISTVTGTGPGAAVRASDIRAAAEHEHATESVTDSGAVIRNPPQPAAAAPAAAAMAPARSLAAMRAQIAAAMTKSKQTVPHYYLSSTIDVAAATGRLREANLARPVADRILLPAVLLCAVAAAAGQVPELNGHWLDGRFCPATAVHLGVVVSLRGGGIILPTIPHADTLDAAAMMSALRAIVSRARAARLRSSDTTPATITVTNLGDLGVDSVFGVIAVPQVAIVGFGAVSERPCAVDGLLGVRPQLTATLSADHRASDGATGARFLNTLSGLLQHPQEL